MLADVNVLVAAHRADHPHHATAARWLQAQRASAEGLSLPPLVLSAFVRLVTHPRIFTPPTPPAQAVDFVDWLLASPNAHLAPHLTARGSEWPALRALILADGLTANRVPDAHLAALARTLGEPLATFDKDFRRLLPRHLLVLLPTGGAG